MSEYQHPNSYAPIQGVRLVPGMELRATDRYASTSGKWEPCSSPGLVIQEGCAVVWVRPDAEQFHRSVVV